MTITEDLGKEERKQIRMLLGHFKIILIIL